MAVSLSGSASLWPEGREHHLVPEESGRGGSDGRKGDNCEDDDGTGAVVGLRSWGGVLRVTAGVSWEEDRDRRAGTLDSRLSSTHFSLPTPDKREYGQVISLL